MTDIENMKLAIDEYLAPRIDAQIDFLRRLVQMPSDNPPGDCAPHAEAAAVALEALGLDVERHPVPADDTRAAGMVTATNLIVRERFGPGPVIALNAHGDVVPPGTGWTADPYGGEIRDGWMYGRGAATSKSDFATYAYALVALKALNRPLAGTVELHLTYDEEVGGEIGPKWLLDNNITSPDYAICAGFSYAVVAAHNGCLHLEVTIRGKSAHAAMPETGADALEAAVTALNRLYDMRRAMASAVSNVAGVGHPNLVVGLIAGGINTNVVPDLVTFRIDRRIIPEENSAEVERLLTTEIRSAIGTMPDITYDVRRVLLAQPLVPLPDQDRLVDALTRSAEAILGEPISAVGSPLYTDARHYCSAGIPTVLYGAGPRSILEANAHRADERLPLSDLAAATRVVAHALYDLMSEH